MSEAYELLAALARRQQELIDQERYEELAELGGRWESLVRSLPVEAPADARSSLEEAERALSSNIGRVEAALAAVRGELARLGASRRVATSYGGAEGLEGASTVDAQV